MNRLALHLLAAAAFAVTGCTMAPKYARPGVPVPESWPESAAEESGSAGAPAAQEFTWREFFTDPKLRPVIESALANNRDLRIAALNVEKAQALYRIRRSEFYPGVGVQADGSKSRLPERMSEDGEAAFVEEYSVNIGVAAWELDLFGRIRSLKKSALNRFLATDRARAAAQLSLVAAVARSYLNLAADREGLGLARATLEAQRISYEMILASRDAGIASDLDLSQAQSQVDAARADLARYTGLVTADENALALLVGVPLPPEALPGGLGEVEEMKEVSGGLSSEVLLTRPDIMAAEYELIAANADIGAARAAFFPVISLTAGLGTMSSDLSGLFESGSHTWSFVPRIVAPIFAGGGLRSNLRVSEVDREIAVARYERKIQEAFREVSDALALRKVLADELDARRSLVAALEESYRLSEARYRAGLDGYLGVLVTERSLYRAKQGLLEARLAHQANRVTLYKVLGGGPEDRLRQ